MALKYFVLLALICTCIAYPVEDEAPSADVPVLPLSTTINNNEPPRELVPVAEQSEEKPNGSEESDLKTANTWWRWRPYYHYSYPRYHSYPIVYYKSYPTYRSYWPLW